MAKKKVLRLIDPEDKGNVIRFCGGTYHGMYGWIDRNYAEDELTAKINVIVFVKAVYSRTFEKNVDKGYYTQVLQSSVMSHTKPTCWEEACLQQDKKLEKAMNDLLTRMVANGITAKHAAFFAYMAKRLEEKRSVYDGPIGFKINYEGNDDPRDQEEANDDVVGDMS